ncbi:MAG TPA: hypothetical protein VJL29_03745 [Thermoguttaceae bacterium]|nr:hypothetical protein [Thermoguttaceae bacterium]
MNDVLTVVSLVIAICGAAFMAIAAIRDHFRDTIAEIRKQANLDADFIKASKNEATKKHGSRKYKQLKRRLFYWSLTSALPVTVFVITTYYVSIHTLSVCWQEVPCQPSIWQFYKIWLIVLLSINGVAIIVHATLLLIIKATSEDLHAHAEAKSAESPEQHQGVVIVKKKISGLPVNAPQDDPGRNRSQVGHTRG